MGKWLECDVVPNWVITKWQRARCSECGLWHITPRIYKFKRFGYCPRCGEKMEKEKDDA